MKPFLMLLALLAIPVAFAQNTVHVYPDGSAQFHATQTTWLRGGNKTIRWQPVSPKLDPASVRLSKADGTPVDILSQRFLHDSPNLLSLFRGQEVQVGELSGTLIASKDNRVSILQLADGALILNPGGPIVLPKVDPPLALDPTLVWQLNTAPRGEIVLALSYRSKDITWNSDSAITFTADMSKASIAAAITLANNSGVDLIDTRWVAMHASKDASKSFSLPGRHSLNHGDRVRIPTIALAGLPVATVFTFDAEGKPQVKKRLASRARIELPDDLAEGIPTGTASLSRVHASGVLDSLGSHKLGDLRPKGKIDIKLGDAPDLEGERKQDRFKELPGGKAQQQDITITIHNKSDAAHKAEIIEHPWGEWEIIDPSQPFKKAGKNVVFAVDIPAKGKTTLTYKLRVAY